MGHEQRDEQMLNVATKQSGAPASASGDLRPNHHPGRTSTVILDDHFGFIKRVQAKAHSDTDLPKFDHGLLCSAALEIVRNMDNAEERIIQSALQLSLRRRPR